MSERVLSFSRRDALRSLAALGLACAGPVRTLAANPKPHFAADPFSLGVASGYPEPDGMVLWTRLAPLPNAPGGGMDPEVVPVRWEVASDERFGRVAASGTAYADPAWGQSVHVEVTGLEAARPYWFRFHAGSATSPAGRTRTAPAREAHPSRLRFAFASCQQYEQGYYGAYRHMLRDDPDLVLFLGDYIYESSWGRDPVRRHGTPEPVTLDDYRARYALYKSDPDLMAMHAAAPWVVTWDDHEVQNDYANDRSQNGDDPQWFLMRRAAAYKAYYEHMPLRRSMLPLGSNARLYTHVQHGSLATFHVLDDRQYRSPEACPRPGRGGGSNTVDVTQCAELSAPGRTMLGAAQGEWFGAGLSASKARWNVVAQQTLMAQFNQKAGDPRGGGARRAWTDGWDGYPAARRELLTAIEQRKPANPVVIGGDVHMFYVADLKSDFDNPASPTIASEFVGTSITSQSFAQETVNRLLPDNPHIRLGDSRYRGYVRVEVTPERMSVDLRAMENVTKRDAGCSTLASFVVEDGRPGAQKV